MFAVTIPARQFALFRVLFGLYLAIHFAMLLPYGAELFGHTGVLPEPQLNLIPPIFPNVLNAKLASGTISIFLIGLSVVALLFAAGVGRRTAAILLWYGWACLFNRNNLIANPSIPYVGLLLLLTILVPLGESWAPRARREDWQFPKAVYWAAWIPLAAGYTYSGLLKLGSPSWVNGEALRLLADNPLARPGPIRDWLLTAPDWVIHSMTWFALAGEILFAFLSFTRVTRFVAWAWLIGMHVGILAVISFADLTAGMLLVHLFVWDPAWVRLWKASPA
jgi:hypothetical protein